MVQLIHLSIYVNKESITKSETYGFVDERVNEENTSLNKVYQELKWNIKIVRTMIKYAGGIFWYREFL